MDYLELLLQKILMLDVHLLHPGVVATRRIQGGRDCHLAERVARDVTQEPPQAVAAGENTHSAHVRVGALDERGGACR